MPKKPRTIEKHKKLVNQTIQDSYSNILAGIGVGSNSKLQGTRYVYNKNITWNFEQLFQLQREQPLIRKIIDYQVSSMLKGIDIVSNEITSEELKAINEKLSNLYSSMYNFLFQAKIFGGGAGMLMFEGDNPNTWKQPLDIKSNTKKFIGIKPLERWFGVNPTNDLIDVLNEKETLDPQNLGKPRFYNVSFGGSKSKSYKVHFSRLLIYNTGSLSYVQERMEQFWGVSLLERIYDPLNRYNTILNAIANKYLIASQRVVKIDETIGYAENDETVREMIKNKLSAMADGLQTSNVLFLDKDDEFQYETVSMSGDSEILKQMAIDLCASAPAPYSSIFDDGFNDAQATENSHRFVKNEQELFIRNYYNKLIKIIYKELFKKEAPTFKIQFKSIREISEKDKADIVYKSTQSIVELYKANIMNKEIAIKSLTEVTDNINDIFNNFDADFLEKYGKLTYNEEQIKLAFALNKSNSDQTKEKFGGENKEKKPTPRPKVGE